MRHNWKPNKGYFLGEILIKKKIIEIFGKQLTKKNKKIDISISFYSISL